MPRKFRIRDGAYPHFITSTFVDWLGLLCRDDYFQVLAASLRHCCEKRGLLVHAYVLMPSHFHAICSCEGNDLPDVVRDMKKHTAKVIARKLEKDGRSMWLNACLRASGRADGAKVWQPEYHPVEMRTQPVFEQRVNNVHNNPVRAGYVEDAVQ